jgi:serine/threonine protein kinase
LEEDAGCVTYLAEIPNEAGVMVDPVKVVVKFVARYSEEVHEFLARQGYAPALRYYGPLPENKLSGIFPGPAQRAAPGLCLRSDLMHVVVMDYIPPQSNAPPDASGQIQAVLSLLHSKGYVFGDLRKQNILFGADGKVKLIDFNWCGRYDMNIPDEKLPSKVQDLINENRNRVQLEMCPMHITHCQCPHWRICGLQVWTL